MTAGMRRGKAAYGNSLILETPVHPSGIETMKPLQIFPGNSDFFVYAVSALRAPIQMIVWAALSKVNRGEKALPIAETFLAI